MYSTALAPIWKSSHSLLKEASIRFGGPASDKMRPDYGIADEDYTATVAAAAYAVVSFEEAEEQNRRKMREYFESSRTGSTTINIKSDRQSTERANSRRSANGEASGDTSIAKFPRRSSYAVGGETGMSRRVAELEAKADAWEKAQREKIRKRHEDMKSAILVWETEKKKEAKLLFNKRKQELDYKGQINKQHYQNEIARIDGIARKAMMQAEEKRRAEESRVKEKAKKIRSRKSRLMCLCC